MAENLQNDTWNRASPGLTVGSPDLDNFSHLIAVQGRHESGNICDRVGIVKAPETIPPDPIPVTPSETESRGQNTCEGVAPVGRTLGGAAASPSVISSNSLKKEHGGPLADVQALSNMLRE